LSFCPLDAVLPLRFSEIEEAREDGVPSSGICEGEEETVELDDDRVEKSRAPEALTPEINGETGNEAWGDAERREGFVVE